MSEDVEQQFQTWLDEHPKSWWDVRPAYRSFFFFAAGVASQQARIAELEAERDRLLNAAALLYGSHAQVVMDTKEDRELQQRVLSTARELVPDIEKRAAITPKEESRG